MVRSCDNPLYYTNSNSQHHTSLWLHRSNTSNTSNTILIYSNTGNTLLIYCNTGAIRATLYLYIATWEKHHTSLWPHRSNMSNTILIYCNTGCSKLDYSSRKQILPTECILMVMSSLHTIYIPWGQSRCAQFTRPSFTGVKRSWA